MRLVRKAAALAVAVPVALIPSAGARLAVDGDRSPASARLGAPPPRSSTGAGSVTAGSAEARSRPRWKRHIDNLTRSRSMGVSVRIDGEVLYQRAAKAPRVPASNQKLLLSMTLLDSLGPDRRLPTRAAATTVNGGVVVGDLWILGSGDPAVTGGGAFGRRLSFKPTRVGTLVRRIRNAGITRIRGSVKGSTRYFRHDWFAPGWKSSFPSTYVALPSALTFEGNTAGGRHISDPERRVARAVTRKLRNMGVVVDGRPRTGAPPTGLNHVAVVRSQPLKVLLAHTNRRSSNFFAEVLGKRAGVAAAGAPGTIAKGARAISSYVGARNTSVSAYDSSGLSYANRISARALARLLDLAEDEVWGPRLRWALPRGGWGTLANRLRDVRVRAKTGTLSGYSTLSGWVWLDRRDTWASFSIMSNGMSKATAVGIEDRIVRILAARAN